jgi:hypothetical protein
MKKAIFETGGRFLLGQDFLLIQDNYKEITAALAKAVSFGLNHAQPIVLTGVAWQIGAGTITASEGWFYWQETFYKFIPPDAPIAVVGLENVAFYREEVTLRSLRYKVGGTPRKIHTETIIRLQTLDWVNTNVAAENRILVSDVQRVYSLPPKAVIEIDILSDTYSNCFDNTGLGINQYTGWAICNGQNGTLNRSGRVPVQASDDPDFDTLGKKGGSKTATLSAANMPPHNHNIPVAVEAGPGSAGGLSATTGPNALTSVTGGAGGQAQPFSILQPYIVTLFIQRLY